MKKILIAVLALASAAVAQQVPGIFYVTTAPSGACAPYDATQVTVPGGLVYTCQGGTWAQVSGGGSGTVSTFSAGTLSPLFTTSVATATTTPALSFALSNAAANTLLGNFTSGSAGPSFNSMPSCSAGGSALIYTSGTGFGCGTTFALTGADINTSNQVTATHLAAALPVNQGGTGTTSTIPGWLSYLGDGSEGALNCSTSISASGEHWYSSFTVSAGNSCNIAARSSTIRVTGACTINGTLHADAVTVANTSVPIGGGSGGGGGGGAGGGSAGTSATNNTSTTLSGSAQGGTAGTAGNPGGNGNPFSPTLIQAISAAGMPGGYAWGGAIGGAGANSGGAAGNGGEAVVLICGSLAGTGTIRADGGYGSPSAANSTGAGGGGGGGVIVTRSPADTSTLTLITNGAPGGSNVVPMAQWYGGGNSGLTTTTTVGGGAITACSVGGTTTNWLAAPDCKIVGGGGASATCHFTTSGSTPTLTITGCVVDAGGSGYTATTYTSSGAGGAGGAGWSKQFTH